MWQVGLRWTALCLEIDVPYLLLSLWCGDLSQSSLELNWVWVCCCCIPWENHRFQISLEIFCVRVGAHLPGFLNVCCVLSIGSSLSALPQFASLSLLSSLSYFSPSNIPPLPLIQSCFPGGVNGAEILCCSDEGLGLSRQCAPGSLECSFLSAPGPLLATVLRPACIFAIPPKGRRFFPIFLSR